MANQSLTETNAQGFISGLSLAVFAGVSEALAAVAGVDGLMKGKLVAVNAEKILSVRENPKLHHILSEESLLYADGISVVWHLRRQGLPATKVAGCELWQALMRCAGEKGYSVCLIGATEDVNKRTAEKLKDEFGVQVARKNGFFDNVSEIVSWVERERPDIVTVALGSPKQEYLMQELYERNPHSLYMGVGGSYDIFVGDLRRAPKWMLAMHLEFLYRLIQQPRRYKRYFRLSKFVWLSLLGQINAQGESKQ